MKISRITSVLFLLAVVAAGGAGCSLGRDTAAGSGNVAEGRSAADRTKEGRVKITVSVWDNANSPSFRRWQMHLWKKIRRLMWNCSISSRMNTTIS